MKSLLFSVVALLGCVLQSAEYFVSPSGRDDAGGKSEKTAFKTIQRGVNALKAGDTLTILPGKYHEAVKRSFDGDKKKKTVIRAKIPGTVLIHGDLPLTGFRLHDRARGIYVTACAREPESVFERDTFKLYERMDQGFLLAPLPASAAYYYDAVKKLLYVRTTDAEAPSKHLLAKGMFPADGFSLVPGKSKKVTNVELDGLTVRGFMTQKVSFFFASWGIVISNAENCRIRRCTAVLNCGGISMNTAWNSRIEECTALGNGTLRQVSGGNIIIWSGTDSVIDNCFSFNSRTYGIRFYGSNKNTTISRSVSIGDQRGAIWIKPSSPRCRIIQVFAPAWVACRNSENSVFVYNDYDPKGKRGGSSLALGRTSAEFFPGSFADVSHFDFRLTSDSRFKQGFAGQKFCYIAWNGSDKNNGLSLKTPRKSLKGLPAGTTVYLLPGSYPGDLEIVQDGITLAGYGQNAPAVIGGKVTVSGKNVSLKRLSFTTAQEAVSASAEGLRIENCGFSQASLAVRSTKEVTLEHCAFAPKVKKIISAPRSVISMSILNKVPAAGVLFGNAYPGKVPARDGAGVALTARFNGAERGDFTLKNEAAFLGTAADGRLIGPAFYTFGPGMNRYFNMKVIPTGSTTASMQFESDAPMKSSRIQIRAKKGGPWRSFTDTTVLSTLVFTAFDGLKPDTQYECLTTSSRHNRYRLGNRYLSSKIDLRKPGRNRSKVLTFTTPATDFPAKKIYVSVKGDDRNPGTKERPMRTIMGAALKTVPGSTVIVKQGVYRESVLVPVSGAPGKPITYCAAPGESVVLDGNNRQSCRGFAAFDKKHLNFDGFRLRMYGTALINASGIFNFFRCNDIKVTRSLYDGRSPGYSPSFLHARFSENILMKNCVAIGGMTGLSVVQSSNIAIVNNVLKMPSIWTLAVFGCRKGDVRFERNILTDTARAKTFEPFIKEGVTGSVVEADNIYYARFPRELRFVAGLHSGKKWTLDEYYRQIKKNGRSVFANPNFKAMPKQLTWKNAAERLADMKKGIPLGHKVNNYEFARDPKNSRRFRVWDFRDFFSAPLRKTGDGKVIGIEPEAFKGFSHLSAMEGEWRIFQ